jgi:hypothetical protein
MTSKKLEELKTALNSAGFLLLRIEERVKTNLWIDGDPCEESREDPPTSRVSVRNRIYLDVVPLPLPADIIQQ